MAGTFSHVGMTYKSGNVSFSKTILIDKDTMLKLGEESKDEIQKILKPLSRSGSLEESWNVIANSSGFKIFSDDWAASSIQTGWNQPPPKDVMMDWMKLKPEFSGLDETEMSRVSYAIRLSMLKGAAIGPTSTIAPLAPAGKRRFDYFKVASNKIIDLIQKTFI